VFVLGIDPGLSRCGYGVVGRVSDRFVARAAGVLVTDPALELPRRLADLARELGALMAELRPDAVAVERVLFQANARTAMSVGQASGLALAIAADAGLPVAQFSANEVKMAVTGHGAARKADVQRMVALLCGLSEVPAPPDVADALGLAICHLTQARGRALVAAAEARDARRGSHQVAEGLAGPTACAGPGAAARGLQSEGRRAAGVAR
jgi:crossover junction endodeoxyribonuclease RuvC